MTSQNIKGILTLIGGFCIHIVIFFNFLYLDDRKSIHLVSNKRLLCFLS